MRSKYVQITPAYPPSLSGVGDYAFALVEHGLFEADGVSTIVTDNKDPELCYKKNTLHTRSTAQSLEQALKELSPKGILLHLSGYGYSRWGLCYWLVNCLRDWKKDNSNHRIVVIYHEVFATGPPWKTSFWTSLPQRHICRELSQISVKTFVTSPGGYDHLRLCNVSSAELLPVFSTVGEPSFSKPITQRARQAVVFGSHPTRLRCYSSALLIQDLLTDGFERIGVDEVIDIGPGTGAPHFFARRPVRQLGSLLPAQISSLMSDSRVGLIDYSFLFIDKSTVAAAYLAHGCLLINTHVDRNLHAFSTRSRLVSASPEQLLENSFDPVNTSRSGNVHYQHQRIKACVDRLKGCFF